MPKLKRKQSRKITKRKTVKQLNDGDMNVIPPHLLDNIPSGAAIKPSSTSATTLRNILMQRFASPFTAMPILTPQQQQAQSMKNSNDLQEQAIIQAKQQLIAEQERKKDIKHQRLEYDKDRQSFEHQMKYQDELNKLKIDKQRLENDKELINKDNHLKQLRDQVEAQKALVEQAKYNNKKLAKDLETNRYNKLANEYNHEYNKLVNENNAMIAAINQFNSPYFGHAFNSYITNIAKAKADQMVLNQIRETSEQIALDKLKAMAQPNSYHISASIRKTESKMKHLQKAIVEQHEANKKLEEQKDLLDFMTNARNQLVKDKYQAIIDNETLKMQTTDSKLQSNSEKLKKAAREKALAVINKEDAETVYNANKDRMNAERQQNEYMIRMQLLNSPDIVNTRVQIANTQAQAKHLNDVNIQLSNVISEYNKALQSRAQLDVKRSIIETQQQDGDPISMLEQAFKNANTTPEQQEALLQQANKILNTIQANEMTAVNLRDKFKHMYTDRVLGQHLHSYVDEYIDLHGNNFNNFIDSTSLNELTSLAKNYNDWLHDNAPNAQPMSINVSNTQLEMPNT